MYQFKELQEAEIIVEVFKTNVQKESDRDYIMAEMQNQFPAYKVNFDLEDCDKILRVEGLDLKYENVINQVNGLGYTCVRLE